MLNDLADQLNLFILKSKIFMIPWLKALGILWGINIVNWIIGSPLNRLGLYPRRLSGLPGIVFSPFLHQDFNHLFFNSIPLFVLGLVLLAQNPETFYSATLSIIILGGLLVWLFGRSARHIGASGVISGYFGFIVVSAYLHPGILTFLLALLILYYFGSIFLGIFPQEEQVSWESHLLGFIAGIATALMMSPGNPFFEMLSKFIR